MMELVDLVIFSPDFPLVAALQFFNRIPRGRKLGVGLLFAVKRWAYLLPTRTMHGFYLEKLWETVALLQPI